MARGYLICALMLVLAVGALRADEVWLKNDNMIEGTILVDRSDRVVILTAGGKLTIPRDQIREVVRRKVQPPTANGREAGTEPPPTVEETKPPKEEPKPPKEEAQPPKEEPKPPREEPQPPKVVLEPKTPAQREFLELLERREEPGLADEERARLDERLADLVMQDSEFAFRVFDAEPMNRRLVILGLFAARRDPVFLPHLEGRLANDNPSVRAAIVSVLGLFEGDEHISRLRQRLPNEAPSVQAAILEQFERRAFVEATDDVVPLLVNPVDTVRNHALATLKRFASVRTDGEQPYDLARHLGTIYAEEPEGELSLAILRVLSDVGGMTAVDTLRSALSSDDATQREIAVRGLGKMATRAATMEILALAEQDPERPVRLAAIKAIELIKDPAATERLIALMDTEDAELQSAVHRALKVITNQTIGKSYDDWAAWWESQH